MSGDLDEMTVLDGHVLDAMTDVMAGAFYDDPMQRWLFPNGRRRRARLRRVYDLDVRHRLNGNAVPVVVEEVGVGFWHPPGDAPMGIRSAMAIAPGYASVAAHHPVRALRVLREVLARRPDDPHWYLSHLAVASDRRGAGIGRRLLGFGIDRAAADGVGVYLETTNPTNLRFYGAAGFTQVGVVDVPNAPSVWLLWLEPRQSHYDHQRADDPRTPRQEDAGA